MDQLMTVVGNLVDEPEHRAVRADLTLVRFRIASTHRYRDSATGEWRDGNTLFLDCIAWRNIADHAGASLHKGDRVVVLGRLSQRGTTYELECEEVAVSLRYATAVVTRAPSRRPALQPVASITG